MGKALEAGQLAGFLVVDLDTDDIKIGTATTINASSGDITSNGDITSSGIISATAYYGSADNLNFGILNATELRSVANTESVTSDKFDSSAGTVTLTYGTDSMVAICTNPSSNITLKVNSIPTTSDFDSQSLSFSVVVINTGVARTCTTVYFNNQVMPVKWFGGSLTNALSGGVTRGTTGYDIFNFIGINTIGPASNISNYEVLGVVNGNFF